MPLFVTVPLFVALPVAVSLFVALPLSLFLDMREAMTMPGALMAAVTMTCSRVYELQVFLAGMNVNLEIHCDCVYGDVGSEGKKASSYRRKASARRSY